LLSDGVVEYSISGSITYREGICPNKKRSDAEQEYECRSVAQNCDGMDSIDSVARGDFNFTGGGKKQNLVKRGFVLRYELSSR
jgi:hypothetical protein